MNVFAKIKHCAKRAAGILFWHARRWKATRPIVQAVATLVFVRALRRKVWLGDGGGFYVCPDILPKRDAPSTRAGIAYCVGVGDTVAFDMALDARFAFTEILLFDPTPMTVEWMKGQHLPDRFKFFPVGIARHSGTANFYLPADGKTSTANSASAVADGNWYVSKSNAITVNMKSIGDVATEHGHTFVDILKMDIEGSEFEVIDDIAHWGVAFGQICVEFHYPFFPDKWRLLFKAIRRLREHGYVCFAVNYNILEFSFVNLATQDDNR